MSVSKLSVRSSGFTLLELLVVVGIILILSALLIAGIKGAYGRASGVKCVNNLKNLQLTWQMYTDDYQGRVPINTSYAEGDIWRSTPESWIGESSAPHDRGIDKIEKGLLFRYDYNRQVGIYKCPADDSLVVGTEVERTRSYSMNGVVGGNVEPDERPHGIVPVIATQNDIRNPSELFVFTGEHEDSIDDAHILVYPAPDRRWVNMPADRHGGNGVLSFADGRAEMKKWLESKDFAEKESFWKRAINEKDLRDLRWLQSHAHAHWEDRRR